MSHRMSTLPFLLSPWLCVFLPASRSKLREVQQQLDYYTMDSQGRKVVVCDNGTGVSLQFSMTRYYSLACFKLRRYIARFAETGSRAVSADAS